LALRAARPIQFPTNIELVQKHYDEIYVMIISAYDGESLLNSSIATHSNDSRDRLLRSEN
jgi:hypothetical protein